MRRARFAKGSEDLLEDVILGVADDDIRQAVAVIPRERRLFAARDLRFRQHVPFVVVDVVVHAVRNQARKNGEMVRTIYSASVTLVIAFDR